GAGTCVRDAARPPGCAGRFGTVGPTADQENGARHVQTHGRHGRGYSVVTKPRPSISSGTKWARCGSAPDAVVFARGRITAEFIGVPRDQIRFSVYIASTPGASNASHRRVRRWTMATWIGD